MIRSRLRRLSSMTREEVAFRAAVMTRIQAQRAAVALRKPQWERRTLREVLAPAALTDELTRSIEGADWVAVQRQLETAIGGRPSQFVLDRMHADDIREAIERRWPDAPAAAAARAERVLEGRYDLLGYTGLQFDGADGQIDWHSDPVHSRRSPSWFWADVPYLSPESGDHKIIWELSRHQHWLTLGRASWLTGDPRYAGAIVGQLASWLRANPPLIGTHWASMLELAFRSMSWLWAMQFLLGARASGGGGAVWLPDMLVALNRQLQHIEDNLSYYFSPNTHLTGEALALYVVGSALPELASSPRWIDTGRRILLAEIDNQISADGGHAERSTHYHRYTLDFYLLALQTAERTGDVEAAARFRDAALRLASFLSALAGDTGVVPQIGDDDGGMLWPITGREPRDVRDSLALAGVLLNRPDLAPWGATEEVYWLAWGLRAGTLDEVGPSTTPVRDRAVVTTDLFGETGYVVIRNGCSDHVAFDVGPHGFLNGGHAHTDPLALTLAVGGDPLLIDPGTVTYTMDLALRNRMRSSQCHNTITLDGRSPSEPRGPFHWRRTADAHLDAVRRNPRYAWSEGHHDGYAPTRHRRSVLHTGPCGWLIVDEMSGTAPHVVEAHWHFHPDWAIASDTDGRLHASRTDGARAWLLHDGGTLALFHGDEATGLGWCSPRYGLQVPHWTARVTRTDAAPLSMVTWVGLSRGSAAPALERLPVETDGHGAGVAVRLHHGTQAEVTLLRSGEPTHRSGRHTAAGGYRTDARLLHYAAGDGVLRSMAIADGTFAHGAQDGFPRVESAEPVEDLFIEFVEGRVDLWASGTPALRLTPAPLTNVGSLRLNGVQAPLRVGEDGRTLVIASASWPRHARLENSVAVAGGSAAFSALPIAGAVARRWPDDQMLTSQRARL